MILEGVVTTQDLAGNLNVAPMGPDMAAGSEYFTLRPFQTSKTFQNLQATRAGVFHITDDVLLLARAAIRQYDSILTRPAATIPGQILQTTGRYLEFRVADLDATTERATVRVFITRSGRQAADLFGLNRAKHAVVEAAILTSRLDILPLNEILADLARLAPIVQKTGGIDEHRAFDLLRAHVQNFVSQTQSS